MRPKVSIVIPYYNRPEKLDRCLNSIYAQTFNDFEIIVIDDYSSTPVDHSNHSIIYIRNEINCGPGISRNRGLLVSKGDYVTFLDCDDYWHTDFLKILYNALENNPMACMTYANGVKIDRQNKVIGPRRSKTRYPTTILPEILYQGRRWGTGGCLWRKSSIVHTEFLEYRNWEDYAFDISVGVKHNTVIPIKENLVFYDASGEDQLSKMNERIINLEKQKSLNAISKLLLRQNYKSNPIINKSITILIILNTIKLIRLDVQNKASLLENLGQIRQWRNFRFYCYMIFLISLPERIGIKYLKLLKRKVNRNQLIILK